MGLEEFYNYKVQFMKDIVGNEEIVRLINEDIPISQSKDLIYTQIFPYEYIPETLDKGHTFVCVDVDIVSSSGSLLLSPVLYVWVMSHKSRLRLNDGRGVRTDLICSKICDVINGSKNYCLGELNLNSVRRFAPVTGYQGKFMTFYAKDINRLHDPKRHIPSNRKNPD